MSEILFRLATREECEHLVDMRASLREACRPTDEHTRRILLFGERYRRLSTGRRGRRRGR